MEAKISKRHHLRRAGLITTAVAVASVFFAVGGILRLFIGPVSLGPFSGRLTAALSDAVPGLSVRYDEAALEWSRDEGRVNLVILGARVFDRDQRIIAQAPKAEIDLAAAPLLSGKVVVRQIALVGVQLTLVHAADGALRLGIERDHEQSDVLDRLRRALSSGGGTSALRSFAVRRARLAFFDERTGLFIVAPQASVRIGTEKTADKAGTVVTAVDALIEISGHRAHLVASLRLPRNADIVAGDVSVRGLAINALGQNTKTLAFLKPYALNAEITGSFTLDHGSTHLRDADFGIGAAGTVSGFGHPVYVKSLRLTGRYDGKTGRLLIDDGALAGDQARARLRGWGDLAFGSDGGLEKSSVDLTVDKIAVNMPGVMQQAVTLARISLRASYTPKDDKIQIQDLLVSGGPLSASLRGEVTLAPGQTPAIAVTGRIEELGARDLLHYWPLQIGAGAREWIAASVLAGNIGPVALKTDIGPGALDLPALPDGAVSLSFPISNGTIVYLEGLTPLTNVEGDGLLAGDSFTGTVNSATVGPLKLNSGKVSIANLHVAGTTGDITAHADGMLSDILKLIDMRPLQYPSRFHIGVSGAKGVAAVDLAFRVPMVRDLRVDDVGISVKGRVTGLALAIGDRKISDGTADVTVDNSSLTVAGKVSLAGANLDVDWNENFKTSGPVTTHIVASGVLDDAARENLNFHSAAFIKGPVNVQAKLDGHRGNITRAQLAMVLTPAAVTLDLINYKKPPGTPAAVNVNARFVGGVIAGGDIVLTGTGLLARGTASFTSTGAIQRLDFPVVRAGPDNDFAFQMIDTPLTGLKATLTGRSADGAGLGRTDLAGKKDKGESPKPTSNEPFHIEAHIDRLALRKGVTMAPFNFSTSGTGDRPQSMTLSGVLSKTATLEGSLLVQNGQRQIRLSTGNAGLLMKGLFGFSSMRGGKLILTAALSPTATKDELAANRVSDYRGSVTISNFTIVDQPFLTRLFSAGSLGGLLDLLGGEGIVIDKLEAPFAMRGDVLDIYGGRASGPSIGITAEGYLDRRNSKIALEGALAPIYGLNSMLGAIPLLGDVLVSKPGEGIIGMSYSVSGDADEPEINVNPLSVLTPGILRRIFEGTPKAPPPAGVKTDAKPSPKNGP